MKEFDRETIAELHEILGMLERVESSLSGLESDRIHDIYKTVHDAWYKLHIFMVYHGLYK